MPAGRRPRIGLALGSGAARGWAHVGVIRELEETGIRADLVCGSSVGSLVAAFHAAGELGAFEDWIRGLQRRQIVGLFDVTLRGGLLKARKILDLLATHLPDQPIENLALPFGAVTTDLSSGQEEWLRSGSLHSAVRASSALPGLVSPVQLDGRFFVDGGLTNPVPVSLCRAMGADLVIAVDLNQVLLRRRRIPQPERAEAASSEDEEAPEPEPDPPTRGEDDDETPAALRAVQDWARVVHQRFVGGSAEPQPESPSIFEVMANGIAIMQIQITRSRMAGDPPDLLVTPRLADVAMFDLDRAEEAIEEGRRAVRLALATGAHLFQEIG